ncbi:MAG TPA: dihydrolipoyllysine-residue succinyltransferase [Opitutaceae bacterium]|jgi:2-oxoglutarate dehydrogenase E2 component (dihydrolipoamide succinyltransferase)|nr:dihydrolipoyllysine-residue succinyltransferase [Opitutaceae bacterium]
MPLLEVKVPAMGESINSGILAQWHVADGDVVRKDQPLFELETDKITSEGTAEAAGKISLKAAAGAEVKIGQVVAVIDTAVAAAPAEKPKAAAPPAAEAKPAPAPESKPAAAAAPAGKAKAEAPAPKPAPAALAAPKPAPAPGTRQTRRKLSPLRLRIAERLVKAQHEAAMLTTFNEADLSAIIGLRTRYQEDFVKKNGIKLGFMSFFVKAAVAALKQVPAVNAQIDGDSVVENHFYDIGVAVSTEKGLLVPVIRDCDSLALAGIEKGIAEAAQKAREGKIAIADLEGGVFTITNGGIFGSMLSTPIINPPQSAILGLHAITERPMAVNGQVVIRPMMYLALSYDHRLIDGREAVTFLVKVKQAIEDPMRLMLNV